MPMACSHAAAAQRWCSPRAIRSGTASAVSLAERLTSGEWIAHSAPSTFSLVASRLGWRLEIVICLGLHAAPLEGLVPHLAHGEKIICLLRDGRAAIDLANWLTAHGWGASQLWTLTALGGRANRITQHRADSYAADPDARLLAVALEAKGSGGLPRSSGLADALFVHDGQITKRPMRALAFSALAPRPGERLWDIGAGSGSISIEWALVRRNGCRHRGARDRAANIVENAEAFGLTHRVTVVEGTAPAAYRTFRRRTRSSSAAASTVRCSMAFGRCFLSGTRLVAHAVTLETEALLSELQQRHGGELMRIEIAYAAPSAAIAPLKPARPVVQWSVVKGGDE